MTTPDRPPLALLIDGENVSHHAADALLREAMTLGDPVLRYVYGRRAAPATVAWLRRADDHGLHMHAPPKAVAGKNAADMSMVIGAMQLFYNTSIRHFCLVSSDSDFTELAFHLREAGCTVWVVGKANAHAALKKACSRFIAIEDLLPPPKTVKTPACRKPIEIVPLISKVLAGQPGRQICGSALGIEIRKKQPGFSSKEYGCAKLIDLIRLTRHFNTTSRNGAVWISERIAAGDTRH